MWYIIIIACSGIFSTSDDRDDIKRQIKPVLFEMTCNCIIESMELAENLCRHDHPPSQLLEQIRGSMRDIHPDLLRFSYFQRVINGSNRFDSANSRELFYLVYSQVVEIEIEQFRLKEYEVALDQYISLHRHVNQGADFDVIKSDFLANLKLSFRDKWVHNSREHLCGYLYYMFLSACLCVESASIIMSSHNDRHRGHEVVISKGIAELYRKVIDLSELPARFFIDGISKVGPDLISANWIPPLDIDAITKIFMQVTGVGQDKVSVPVHRYTTPRDAIRGPWPRDCSFDRGSPSARNHVNITPLRVRFAESPQREDQDVTFLSPQEDYPCTFGGLESEGATRSDFLPDVPEVITINSEILEEILEGGTSEGSPSEGGSFSR